MYTYKGIQINYYDNKKNTDKVIIALHGWGQNIEMMQPLTNAFEKEYRIIILDLPGHGLSKEPKEVLCVEDFCKIIRTFVVDKKIKKPILIGHSFGGKIALLYASKYEIEKLVLLAPTYKKTTKKASIRVRVAKKLKFIPIFNQYLNYLRNKLGSADYKNSSEMMRKIMVKHINTDVTNEISKITVPSLIVWGDKDLAVDVSLAYELEKLIKDSGVVIYKNSTHYAYLENLNNLKLVLKSFFDN